MYQLYTDRRNVFTCEVEVEGSSLDNTVARIILENNEGGNLLFKGSISEHGTCKVPIDNLRKFFGKNAYGKMILEVLVDDTIFKPWESECEMSPSKDVMIAEVKNAEDKEERTTRVKVKLANETATVSEELDKANRYFKELSLQFPGLTRERFLKVYAKKVLKESSVPTALRRAFLAN